MNVPEEFAREFAAFPAALQRLVIAELKSGNAITGIEHGFPAAPCGASIKLTRPVNARRRKSGNGLSFYERNRPDYAGEFTTTERHFFVLEPPLPPAPEPDMDAIRAAAQSGQPAPDEALHAAPLGRQTRARKAVHPAGVPRTGAVPPAPSRAVDPVPLLERFRESMSCNHGRWHDGIGYDLALLKSASPGELAEIERLLVNRGIQDWRDVEALAALDTPRAQALLRAALRSSDPSILMALIRHAPERMSAAERTVLLVKALEKAESFGGLPATLTEVEQFHPPEVVAALLRGALERDGETAAHYAAMLLFIHGRAGSAFDWEHRPFLLRFNTGDARERAAAHAELCARIGVPGTPPA